jgi:hypothetical protein
MPQQFMFSGCICCYNGCDLDNIMLCCKGSQDCLCLTNEHCCAANVDPYGIGMVTDEANKEICKIGLYCCTCGLKVPEVLCSGATHCLCLVDVQSFPFDSDYVAEPVYAYCCLQCLPELGCAKPYPNSPALNKLTETATPAGEVMAGRS